MITYVYAVPFARLRSLIGSKDRAVLRAVLSESGDLIRLADDHLDEGSKFTCTDALAELIDGREFTQGALRYLYRCALEAIWSHIGEFLGELDGAWSDELDEPLMRLGIPLSYGNLVSGDEVISLPAWDLNPYLGSWSPEQVAAALPALQGSGVEAQPWDEDRSYEVMDERIGLIRHIVEEAARRPGWGAVSISY